MPLGYSTLKTREPSGFVTPSELTLPGGFCGRLATSGHAVHAPWRLRGRLSVRTSRPGCLRLLDSDNVPARRDGFERSLWAAVERRAIGDDLSDLKYTVEGTRKVVLRWSSVQLTEGPSSRRAAKKVEGLHSELLSDIAAPDSELVRMIREPMVNWVTAKTTIEAEVDELQLRYMVPGTCDLCPDMERSGSRRRPQ